MKGLPRWLLGKESSCHCRNAGDAGLTAGSGRFPGEGNGSPLQYSCLENPVDREAWQAMVHAVAKSDMTEGLSINMHTNKPILCFQQYQAGTGVE